MENILIKLNRYFNNNKYVLGFIILVVILVLLVVKTADKMRKTEGDSRKTAISESVSNNSITQNNTVTNINTNSMKVDSYNDIKNYVKTKEDYIKVFFNLCKQGKKDLAYQMLSDDCKNILYPNLDSFISSYYNAIFKTDRNCSIISFKNNIYKVSYLEDEITTGSDKSLAIQDYITVNSDGKINISNFIKKENLDISSNGQYFSFKITERQVFVDYEIYTVKIKNNTMADMYFNDTVESNLYVKNSKNAEFSINSSEYIDANYYVPSNSEKNVNLKFNVKYQSDNEIVGMYFENIKIVNKEFYSAVSKDSDGKVKYEKTKTNYPEKMNYIVKFN